jgi:hypothetical protein
MRGRQNDACLALLLPINPQTTAAGQRLPVCKYQSSENHNRWSAPHLQILISTSKVLAATTYAPTEEESLMIDLAA